MNDYRSELANTCKFYLC